MMNSNVQAAMPKFAGLSHVCIFVDDMMEAVDYYQKLLGVVPDHYLSPGETKVSLKPADLSKKLPTAMSLSLL